MPSKPLKKRIFIALMLGFALVVTAPHAVAQQKIAKLKYGGGGDWYANKTALPNLIRFCNTQLSMNLIAEEDAVDVVHHGEVIHVREEHRRLDDVGERAAAGLEHGGEVREHPVRLRRDVALHDRACGRIERHLTRHEEPLSGADRLRVRRVHNRGRT